MTTESRRILVVEDEGVTAMALEESLEGLGYTVVGTAATGEDALELATREQPHLVLMDIRLKGAMNGIQAAARIRAEHRLPVIYLTAYADQRTLEDAKVTEPFGYIVKPFDDRSLHSNIQMALFKHGMEQQLQQNHERLRRSFYGIIAGIAQLVEIKNPYLHLHQQKVAELAREIARRMGLAADRVEGIHLAASIHAIGLIGVPYDTLVWSGQLRENDAVAQLYRTYPAIGHQVLKDVEFEWPVAEIIHQHRELQDGSGFPRGLRGEAILPEAAVVGLAYTITALLSGPGGEREAGLNGVVEEVRVGRGRLYLAEAVDAWLELLELSP